MPDKKNTYLIIPLRLEAKVLEADAMVSPPLGDFTRLPWNNGKEDVNFDRPFLGDGIVHRPFAPQNFLLKAGVHIHFIIPHYLGQPVPEKAGLPNSGSLPAAPNRWLITRKSSSGSTQWVIESDYIHKEDYDPFDASGQNEITCIIPYHEGRPWRYMGRKTRLSDRPAKGDTFRSLNNKPLTVMGYGDINFSSFYPNCLGVFGFSDKDETTANSDLKYSVLGWNADAEDDLLNNAINKILETNAAATADQINSQLRNLFHLEMNLNGNTWSAASRSLFYGEIAIDKSDTGEKPSLSVSVGNTGTEALSALMASSLSDGAEATKSIIEEQLESILLFSKLDHLHVDTSQNFLEARHEKGFRFAHSENIWRIVYAGDSDSQANSLPNLPSGLAELLHKLNVAQFAFDKNIHEINSLREQLYMDWYKYMYAAYPSVEGRGEFPDPDQIRYFIENYSFKELNSLILQTGSVTYEDASKGFQPKASSALPGDLANLLSVAWEAANKVLGGENESRKQENLPLLSFSLASGPRFWEPNAPVVLISGLPKENDTSANQNSPLTVDLYSSSQNVSAEALATQNDGDILTQCSGKNLRLLSAQTWNPFLLDWETGLTDSRFQDEFGAFAPDTIQKNFNLDTFGPDFETDLYQAGNLSVLSGSVLMSAHAGRALLGALASFMATALKNAGAVFTKEKPMEDFLPSDSVKTWGDAVRNLPAPAVSTENFNAITTQKKYHENPVYTAWMGYQALLDKHIISQTLNGFNQACVMRQKTAQLPIAEPLGFADAIAFTEKVKNLVQNNKDVSPIGAFDFNPVRSGKLKINRLRLTDNFGFIHDIDTESKRISAAQTLCDDKNDLFLRPRLSQPARLNFRWLSATPVSQDENFWEDQLDSVETNDHPDTSPVCGWLMTNYVDNFIAVYSADGTALGYIGPDSVWNTLPWATMVADPYTNIDNPYLLQVVLWIINTFQSKPGEVKIYDFLSATQSALNNIAPAKSHLYNTGALLMGRPMAVVRARLSFQTKGLPVLDQSWAALIGDLSGCDGKETYSYNDRHTKNWTKVRFPLRLGEHSRLNDGLVGYWKEGNSGSLSKNFISPEFSSNEVNDSSIETFSGQNFQTQWLSLDDDPVNVTMLVDPHGSVHATSGILPVKAVSIPPEHYLPAMKKINMWFYSAPLLQPQQSKTGSIFAGLPVIENCEWQWWDPFNGVVQIHADDPRMHLHGKFQLMDGWLTLAPGSRPV